MKITNSHADALADDYHVLARFWLRVTPARDHTVLLRAISRIPHKAVQAALNYCPNTEPPEYEPALLEQAIPRYLRALREIERQDRKALAASNP